LLLHPVGHPFCTEKVAVFDDRLLGAWQERDAAAGPQICEFMHGRGKTCELVETEPPGKCGVFTAQLFNLIRDQFLDILPHRQRISAHSGRLGRGGDVSRAPAAARRATRAGINPGRL
jgi:hypothetical protein